MPDTQSAGKSGRFALLVGAAALLLVAGYFFFRGDESGTALTDAGPLQTMEEQQPESETQNQTGAGAAGESSPSDGQENRRSTAEESAVGADAEPLGSGGLKAAVSEGSDGSGRDDSAAQAGGESQAAFPVSESAGGGGAGSGAGQAAAGGGSGQRPAAGSSESMLAVGQETAEESAAVPGAEDGDTGADAEPPESGGLKAVVSEGSDGSGRDDSAAQAGGESQAAFPVSESAGGGGAGSGAGQAAAGGGSGQRPAAGSSESMLAVGQETAEESAAVPGAEDGDTGADAEPPESGGLKAVVSEGSDGSGRDDSAAQAGGESQAAFPVSESAGGGGAGSGARQAAAGSSESMPPDDGKSVPEDGEKTGTDESEAPAGQQAAAAARLPVEKPVLSVTPAKDPVQPAQSVSAGKDERDKTSDMDEQKARRTDDEPISEAPVTGLDHAADSRVSRRSEKERPGLRGGVKENTREYEPAAEDGVLSEPESVTVPDGAAGEADPFADADRLMEEIRPVLSGGAASGSDRESGTGVQTDAGQTDGRSVIGEETDEVPRDEESLQTAMLKDPGPRDETVIRREESPPASAAPVAAPEFDTVRVDKFGIAVISGRAEPETTAQAIVNGKVMHHVEVSRRGQFAMIFEVDAASPALEITLNTLTKDGRSVPSEQSVVVLQADFQPVGTADLDAKDTLTFDMPDVSAGGIQPIRPAVLLSSIGNVKLLQPALPVLDEQTLVEMITYDETGEAVLGGRAGSLSGIVRIYIDNAHIKDAEIQADKSWSARLEEILPGRYTLRVDEVSLVGDVVSRIEMPLQKESGAFVKAMLGAAAVSADAETGVEAEPAARLLTVQRGYTLWGISRNRFGLGRLYVNIFDLNRDQIRDPDLIYPGQIFKMPRGDNLFDPEYGRRFIPARQE